LITKHPIYRERIERDHEFADYAKKHYASWVNFAREQKHQGDVRPILVTGVSLAPEFATVAYSDNRGPRAGCEFSTALPDIASASASGWGTWSVAGLVHTNCGPDPPEQNPRPSPGYAPGSEIPNECTQCVFIDYYTICKRRRIPTAIEVDLGLHQFPTWDYDLDQEGIFYGVDSTEVYIDYSETGLPRYVVYEVVSDFPAVSPNQSLRLPPLTNLTKDDRNGLDVLAEFILNQVRSSSYQKQLVRTDTPQQRSDAEFVLLRHDDIQDFPQVLCSHICLGPLLTPVQGDKEELIRLLAESRVVERVEVDENGGRPCLSTADSQVLTFISCGTPQAHKLLSRLVLERYSYESYVRTNTESQNVILPQPHNNFLFRSPPPSVW